MARRGLLRCLVAAVLFGVSTPAASELARDLPSPVLAGLLYVGAGLAVLPSAIASPPTTVAIRRNWRPALTAVVVGGAIGPVLLVAGLSRTSAAGASIMLNLELAATIVLAAMVFGEHVGGRLLAGAGLITVAGVVLVWEPGAGLDGGAVLIAAACLAWGFDNGVTARLDQLSPEHVVLLKGIVAGSANLGLGLVLTDGLGSMSSRAILAALAIGAAGYGVSIVLWVKGARELGAARGQAVFAAAPFVGAVVAWSVLGESVTWFQVVAVVIAATGVAISLESAHDHVHVHEVLDHEHEHRHDDRQHDHDHDQRSVRAAADQPHTHRHVHRPVTHAHPHVPDLHHRHH